MRWEHWWNDTDKGKQMYSAENLFHCHSVWHKNWPALRLKIRFVPRSKHTPSLIQKTASQCSVAKWQLYVPRAIQITDMQPAGSKQKFFFNVRPGGTYIKQPHGIKGLRKQSLFVRGKYSKPLKAEFRSVACENTWRCSNRCTLYVNECHGTSGKSLAVE
jgi:hypothetical protein